MAKNEATNVKKLDEVRAESILEGVDPKVQKKKILRSALTTLLSVVSEDWRLHAIVEAMAQHYGVDYQALVTGACVKGKPQRSVYEYRKGSRTDKVTKELAKDFFIHQKELRAFVGTLDQIIGSLNGAAATFLVSDSIEAFDNDGHEESEGVLRVIHDTEKGAKEVFSTMHFEEYSIFTSLSADSKQVGSGLERASSGFEILATRLLCAIAQRYGYTLYCSEIGVTSDTTGEVFAFGVALHKLPA